MSSSTAPPTDSSSDDRMIAALRLILAVAGLLIIYINPAEPDRYVAFTYTTLVLYVLYSAALHLLTRQGHLP